jgi:hypothetical protein
MPRLSNSHSRPPIRKLTVIAQDPAVKRGGRIIRTTVDVPSEDLEAGPWGHRVQVVDYDVPRDLFLRPLPKREYALVKGRYEDPWQRASDARLLSDPRFHAQNVYALVMQTLTRFEFALGRPISWPFESHHLKVAPHGIAEANAYYKRSEEALVFGYFPKATNPKQLVHTSLSCTRRRTRCSTRCARTSRRRRRRIKPPSTKGSPTSSRCSRSAP